MASVIYDDPRAVARILRQNFWSDLGQWVEVVKAAVAARGGCTDDFPKSAPGYHAWSHGTARMRQLFRREGWTKGDFEGIETIVHHDLAVQVALMNTDEGTTDRTRSPRNRTVKGPAAERVTDLNNQTEMFRPEEVAPVKDATYPTWYLCVFDNGSIARAELSRPSEFRSRYFEGFSERIFLVSGDDWAQIASDTLPAASLTDFDITVRRRR
jgi:hypothetical protein